VLVQPSTTQDRRQEQEAVHPSLRGQLQAHLRLVFDRSGLRQLGPHQREGTQGRHSPSRQRLVSRVLLHQRPHRWREVPRGHRRLRAQEQHPARLHDLVRTEGLRARWC